MNILHIGLLEIQGLKRYSIDGVGGVDGDMLKVMMVLIVMLIVMMFMVILVKWVEEMQIWPELASESRKQ